MVSKDMKICPVTGEKWFTGEILVAKNTRKKLEETTVTGYAYSPEVQETLDKGYYALIEIDEEATSELLVKKGRLSKLDAVRTGRLMYVHNEFAKAVFGESIEEVNFIDQETFELLKKKQENASITEKEKTTGDGES